MGQAGDLADSLSVPMMQMLLKALKNAEYDDNELCAMLEGGLLAVKALTLLELRLEQAASAH